MDLFPSYIITVPSLPAQLAATLVDFSHPNGLPMCDEIPARPNVTVDQIAIEPPSAQGETDRLFK